MRYGEFLELHDSMPEPMNVLVLGVGGNVSQGILKALAIGRIPCRVVAACTHPRSFGLYTVDRAYVSPPADAAHFTEWVLETCRKERIHAVMSGVEPVLASLAREASRIRAETGAIAVVSSSECLAIGDDKLTTCQWLEREGLAFPDYAEASDTSAVEALVHRCGFPLVAKPRSGKGSSGLILVRNAADLTYARAQVGCVIEEYLGTPAQEYTVGCFNDRDGKVRGALVLHRELQNGTTYRAEAGLFPEVRAEALRIAERLRPLGPSNMQMRIHRGRAVCFEINVRFSGTTPIRARLGFNDVEAALDHFVLGRPAVDLPLIERGIALRYWNEAYPGESAVHRMEAECGLNDADAATVIETYGMHSL